MKFLSVARQTNGTVAVTNGISVLWCGPFLPVVFYTAQALRVVVLHARLELTGLTLRHSRYVVVPQLRDVLRQVEDYGDKAIFVHVYGPEPHPASPDLNFDSGKLLPNYWSIQRQPVTYDDRVEAARNIHSITHPDQVSVAGLGGCTTFLIVACW